jgi:hypothetical protein
MYTVHTDVKMTRRKTMCHITDDAGEAVWSGGSVFDAFEQMIELRQYSFELRHEDRTLRIIVGRGAR